MKRLLAAAMMAALLIVAGVSISRAADTALGVRPFNNNISGVGGLSAADSTRQSFWFQNQSVLTVDPYAPPWACDVYNDAINDTLSVPGWGSAGNGTIAASFTAESTFIFPMAKSGFRTCQMMFQCVADSANLYADTTLVGVFAIQVRGHYSANYDTATTAVWKTWDAFLAGSDTLGLTVRGAIDAVYPGEHLVRVKLGGRGYSTATFSGGSSTMVGNFFASPYPIFLDVADSKGGRPVPPWMSVRVRCVAVYGTLTWAARKLVQPHVRLSLAFGM